MLKFGGGTPIKCPTPDMGGGGIIPLGGGISAMLGGRIEKPILVGGIMPGGKPKGAIPGGIGMPGGIMLPIDGGRPGGGMKPGGMPAMGGIIIGGKPGGIPPRPIVAL